MKNRHLNKYFKLLVQLAMTMVASIGVFFFLGMKVGEFFGFQGVGVGIGTFVGVGVGFVLMLMQLKTFF